MTTVESTLPGWLETLAAEDPARLARLSRPGPRYTSYPTAPEWTTAIGPDDLAEALVRADAEGEAAPLSLYIHLPFCQSMCAYCGCNVVVSRRPERADLYLDSIERELDLVCQRLPRRRSVAQVHLGGGTPTFLDERQLLRLFGLVTSRFAHKPGAEVAIEVDPVVTRREQLALLRGLGANRLSLGIQDFTPEVQERVGRIQTVEQTADLYNYARFLGFTGINIDLIYGLPRQKPETFARTLDLVLDMGPDRVAVFGYAHVPWIRPHQRRFQPDEIPDAPARFSLFVLALRRFLGAGYLQIGMDHFARPDDELALARLERRLHRNFQGYTVKPASDLLAFGITGISEVAGLYAQSLKPLGRYYRALEQQRLPTERGHLLTPDDRVRRAVIHGLMCNFHVDLREVCARHGVEADRVFASELDRLEPCVEQGLLERQGLVLELTPLGRILSRNVAMVFDRYLLERGSNPQGFSKTL